MAGPPGAYPAVTAPIAVPRALSRPDLAAALPGEGSTPAEEAGSVGFPLLSLPGRVRRTTGGPADAAGTGR